MKRTLRKSMIQKRRSMELEEWKQKSHDILTRITASSLIDSKETIMIFMDFRKEVMTKPIISWLWDQGKQVVIPRVKKGSAILDLCLIESFDDMELSSMGILEPKANHDRFAAPADIDFVFMPGVAFTKDGGRLGYGGGYYDQLIPLMKQGTPLYALAFDLQIVDFIPLEDHDIRIHGIITESETIKCQ